MMSPVDLDERSLLEAIKQDAEKSFDLLYNRHWKALFLTAAKVLRSTEEAEDVVHDVFLSFWNKRKDIEITTSVKGYLMTSVKYHAIHYIEKNKSRLDYLSLLSDTLASTVPADAETNMYLKELQKVLDQSVQSMPAKMRTVYDLSRHKHLTHKEIALELGISTETVKKHIQHALQHIRESISLSSTPIVSLLVAILFKD